MGINFLQNINLNQNSINGFVLESLTGAPSNPKTGRLYFDTSSGQPWIYTGGTWVSLIYNDAVAAVSDRVTALETLLDSAENVDNGILDRWTEVVNFLNGLDDDVMLLDKFMPATKGSNGYTITNAIDFENAALTGYSTDDTKTWSISENGVALFTNVMIGSDTTNYSVLHTGNTSVTQTITSGNEIGTITIGDTAVKLYFDTSELSEQISNNADDIKELQRSTFTGAQHYSTAFCLTWRTSVGGDRAVYIPSWDSAGYTTFEKYWEVSSPRSCLISDGFVDALVNFVETSGRYSEVITGNGTKTSYTITHNLGTTDLIVVVYDQYNSQVFAEVSVTNTDITLSFGTALAAGTTYRVVVKA